MKRTVAALLSLMLLLCACPALAGTYQGPLFALRYNDQFSIDQYSYLESGQGKWFFILYDGTHSIDCGMERTDRGAGMTLVDADEMLLSAYASAVCQVTGGSLVEVYRAGNQPFAIVTANRPGLGKVYYAETVVQGAAVYFEMYCMASGTVDAAALSVLKGVLNGFSAR